MPDVPDDLFAGFGRPPAPTGRGVEPTANLSGRWDGEGAPTEPTATADLPELVAFGEGLAPAAPADLRDTGIDAAVLAVQQWQYRPTLLNGEPVPVITTITVNFSLSSP